MSLHDTCTNFLATWSTSDDVLDATTAFVRDVMNYDEPEAVMLRGRAEQFLEEPSAENFARMIDVVKLVRTLMTLES